VSYGPAFDWPPRPRALFKWFFGFPGYLWPWNVLYAAAAILIWMYLTPPLETLKTFSFTWAGLILLRNIVLAIMVYGAWHLWLYVWRKQGTSFKYNRQWPKESQAFLFRNQTYDNMFYTLVSGVPIWTAYEVLLLWAYANNIAPMISYAEHPVGFIALFFLVPFIHEVGFYCAHRLLHWPPLYEVAHKLHHRNTNPGPWSGLPYPIEHVFISPPSAVLPHSGASIHMINSPRGWGGPAQGHTGFDRVVVGRRKHGTSYFAHYLHHKYFEVNYSDGMVPLDKWFGSFHDGTPEANQAMKARRLRRGV
jgi:sterol desaturase/sphingolipid hydroxylase (fatty acid hydroxylase superfamily)